MPNLAQAAKSELFVSVTGIKRPTITSTIQLKGSIWVHKYNVATSLEELGEHQNIQEESMNLEGGKSAKSGPGSQIGAVFFSVTGIKRPTITSIYALRLHLGHKYRCCNKLRRIGEHQNIQEESMNLEGGKSAKSGPGSQIGAVCFCDREKKAHHSFNICSKAPFGSHIQCCNKFRRIGGHQNIQEE